MKQFLLVSLLVAAAAAWPHWASDQPSKSVTQKQHDINRLLKKINEPIPDEYKDLYDLAHNFHPTADLSIYSDGGVAVKKLHDDLEQHHLLEQHHWFSLFNERQREEALMLFEVLISTKDYNGFLSNACYFREHMNEGEFLYAFYVATIHSDHTHGVVVPPLYEVTPHMFTNSEVIHKAYTAQMKHEPAHLFMPFSGSNKNPEQRVAYFGEDVGMNTHHVSWHMDYPFWWQDKYGHHLDRKGELFYWVHHQLTARFDAERLSNNLNIVDELHWDDKIAEGFAPHTIYKYGGEFPSRPDNIYFEDVDGVAHVRDMLITESRIIDAIAHGYIVDRDGHPISIQDEHGIDILGDIIESSVYSKNPQYYGALHNTAHIMLGRQADPHGKFKMPPGVMEHFETATRDPAFFRLHKYLNNILRTHKDSLPPYTKEDLIFDGVSIDSIKIEGDLKTYFENYTFDLSNGVESRKDAKAVDIDVSVSRLNHESFTYNFEVENNNGEDELATFRVFMCPRYDYNHVMFSFDEGRYGCIEVDKFWEHLKPGHNVIKRKSTDSSVTVPDRMSFNDMYEKTTAAVNGGHDVDFSKYERSCGIPERMLLPKGKPQGMEFALAVAVTDGDKDLKIADMDKNQHGGTFAQCGVHGEVYPDKRPLGYPLDRKIEDPSIFTEVPNYHKIVVKIFHDDHH